MNHPDSEPNPFAPPQTPVADIIAAPGANGQPVFFAVSLTKLLVMSLCTLGLYQYYWFYQNLRILRDRTGEDISPFWRTFFAVFFVYQLFDQVRKHAPESPAAELSAGPIAAAWIILSLTWKLPDPYWLIAFTAIFPLLPVQSAINALNRTEAPGHDPNWKFSGWNWLAVVIGLPVLILALIGAFMAPPP